MCLESRTIYTKSRYMDRTSFLHMALTVPCGHCAECLSMKRNQWYLRNYWQCKETIDRKGYIFFDTFTYRNDTLPHLSDFFPELKDYDFDSIVDGEDKYIDFSCFDSRHYALFMRRLRKNLDDAGYDVDGNLKCFYVSEYGKCEEYRTIRGSVRRGTTRPHYHALFYVTIPDLHPLEFARFLYEAWQYGKTDSYDAHGNRQDAYILEHNVFGQGYGRTDDVSLRRVASYVAKYVTKDAEFTGIVNSRMDRLMSALSRKYHHDEFAVYAAQGKPFPWYRYQDLKALEKRLRRYIEVFHRQSQCFGMYALSNMDDDAMDLLFSQQAMKMPDEQDVVKFIPVPDYYVRKLFYTLIWDDSHEHSYWKLNDDELSRSWYWSRVNVSRDNIVKRFENWYVNLDVESQSNVVSALDGRTFTDLADYMLFYRGRIAPPDGFLSPDVVVNARMEWNPFVQDAMSVIHNCEDGIHEYRKSDYVFGSYADGAVKDDFIEWLNEGDWYEEYVTPRKDFCRRNVINQDYRYEFRDFDSFLVEYSRTISASNAEKQKVFDMKERLRKVFSK